MLPAGASRRSLACESSFRPAAGQLQPADAAAAEAATPSPASPARGSAMQPPGTAPTGLQALTPATPPHSSSTFADASDSCGNEWAPGATGVLPDGAGDTTHWRRSSIAPNALRRLTLMPLADAGAAAEQGPGHAAAAKLQALQRLSALQVRLSLAAAEPPMGRASAAAWRASLAGVHEAPGRPSQLRASLAAPAQRLSVAQGRPSRVGEVEALVAALEELRCRSPAVGGMRPSVDAGASELGPTGRLMDLTGDLAMMQQLLIAEEGEEEEEEGQVPEAYGQAVAAEAAAAAEPELTPLQQLLQLAGQEVGGDLGPLVCMMCWQQGPQGAHQTPSCLLPAWHVQRAQWACVATVGASQAGAMTLPPPPPALCLLSIG